ncbi:hypothetical protein K438DRAFT_1801031, partial [Mycena galopus ATCC 62051]
TIRAAIDYQRPKYANFAHFDKKDALADNGEHRDLGNDLEPLPLPMNKWLHRVDLRWINDRLLCAYGYTSLVVISPSEKTPPARPHSSSPIRHCAANYFLIGFSGFTPRCVCDGRKNIFSIHQLKLDTGFQEFDESPSLRDQKRPKVYNIKLTLVAETNPEVLHCFIKGKASHDNTVLTATVCLFFLVISLFWMESIPRPSTSVCNPACRTRSMLVLSSPTARPRTSAPGSSFASFSSLSLLISG